MHVVFCVCVDVFLVDVFFFTHLKLWSSVHFMATDKKTKILTSLPPFPINQDKKSGWAVHQWHATTPFEVAQCSHSDCDALFVFLSGGIACPICPAICPLCLLFFPKPRANDCHAAQKDAHASCVLCCIYIRAPPIGHSFPLLSPDCLRTPSKCPQPPASTFLFNRFIDDIVLALATSTRTVTTLSTLIRARTLTPTGK